MDRYQNERLAKTVEDIARSIREIVKMPTPGKAHLHVAYNGRTVRDDEAQNISIKVESIWCDNGSQKAIVHFLSHVDGLSMSDMFVTLHTGDSLTVSIDNGASQEAEIHDDVDDGIPL